MEAIRNFIKNVTLKTVVDNVEPLITDEESFREHMLEGFEKILQLKDKHKNKEALVMGHGPTLLNIDKEKYRSHIKITCNDFHKIADFFDGFTPDFWCAANSYEHLKTPFEICLEKNINTFVTIPRKGEFVKLLNIAETRDKMNLVHAWQWEHRIFQNMLATKYERSKIYTHCNTVTNHMIALALWLGCSAIDVTGFDLSYKKSLENTGMTHAGYKDEVIADDHSKSGVDAFDDPRERGQIISDLRYLCAIANSRSIRINNLSHEVNGLPKTIA